MFVSIGICIYVCKNNQSTKIVVNFIMYICLVRFVNFILDLHFLPFSKRLVYISIITY